MRGFCIIRRSCTSSPKRIWHLVYAGSCTLSASRWVSSITGLVKNVSRGSEPEQRACACQSVWRFAWVFCSCWVMSCVFVVLPAISLAATATRGISCFPEGGGSTEQLRFTPAPMVSSTCVFDGRCVQSRCSGTRVELACAYIQAEKGGHDGEVSVIGACVQLAVESSCELVVITRMLLHSACCLHGFFPCMTWSMRL